MPAAIKDAIRKVVDPSGTPIHAGKDEFAKALALIKDGKPINYEGVIGPVSFDQYGDITGPFRLWRIEGRGDDGRRDERRRGQPGQGRAIEIAPAPAHPADGSSRRLRETFISRRSLALLLTAARSLGWRDMNRLKSRRSSTRNWQKSTAMTSAVRRSPLSSAISPKKAPDSSRIAWVSSLTSTAPEAMKIHRVAAVALADHPLAGRGGARPEQQQQLLLVLDFDVGKQREGFEQLFEPGLMLTLPLLAELTDSGQLAAQRIVVGAAVIGEEAGPPRRAPLSAGASVDELHQRIEGDRQDCAGQDQVLPLVRQQAEADAEPGQNERELADLRQAAGDGQPPCRTG